MRLHRTLALLVAVAAGAGAAGAGATASAATSVESSKTGVVTCAGKVIQEPRKIDITCADAGVMITKITWTSWTDHMAKGTGTLVWNTCLPRTCVAGVKQPYKVAVTLGSVASTRDVPVFSQVQLTFLGTGPAFLETGSYTLEADVAGQV